MRSNNIYIKLHPIFLCVISQYLVVHPAALFEDLVAIHGESREPFWEWYLDPILIFFSSFQWACILFDVIGFGVIVKNLHNN